RSIKSGSASAHALRSGTPRAKPPAAAAIDLSTARRVQIIFSLLPWLAIYPTCMPLSAHGVLISLLWAVYREVRRTPTSSSAVLAAPVSDGVPGAVLSEHFFRELPPHSPSAHIAAHGKSANTVEDRPAATIHPQPAKSPSPIP